jgi:type II secretory pathway component PulJ
MRQRRFFKNKLHQHIVGFSLIELMIAIFLSVLISTVLIDFFITAKKSFQTQSELNQLQENTRIISHLLAAEIREAKNISLYEGHEIKNGTQSLLLVRSDASQKAFFISKNNNLYLKNFSGLSLSLVENICDMKIFFDVNEKNQIREISSELADKNAEIVGVAVRLLYCGKNSSGRGIYVYAARR